MYIDIQIFAAGKTEMRQKREMKNGLMTAISFRFYYHKPQWYVEAAYNLLAEEQKAVHTGLDDTFSLSV